VALHQRTSARRRVQPVVLLARARLTSLTRIRAENVGRLILHDPRTFPRSPTAATSSAFHRRRLFGEDTCVGLRDELNQSPRDVTKTHVTKLSPRDVTKNTRDQF